MFKPHDRYTAEYPVLQADLLPEYGSVVHLKFTGWYQNDLIFTVWPVGVDRPKELDGRYFLWVDPTSNSAMFDARAAVMGTGKPPENATGYITNEQGQPLLECWPIKFSKV